MHCRRKQAAWVAVVSFVCAAASACSDDPLSALPRKPPPPDDDGFSFNGLCEAPPTAPVEVNPDCRVPRPTPPLRMQEEWRMESFGDHEEARDVVAAPVVADVDGDGAADIVIVCYEPVASGAVVVRVLRGDGGGQIWSYRDDDVTYWRSPAAADIDGDGFVEVLVPSRDGLRALDRDGALLWASEPSADSEPGIADLDHDGDVEILVGEVILDHEGTVITTLDDPAANASIVGTAFAADVDGDGIDEVVTGNGVYRANGERVWSDLVAAGYAAIVDVDDDYAPEVVITRWFTGKVQLHDDDGVVLWSFLPDEGDDMVGAGPPTVADFDGDGEPEIAVGSRRHFTVLETDGSVLWQREAYDVSSGAAGAIAFDFDFDGASEVVYADERDLFILDGRDGSERLVSHAHSSVTLFEYPLVVDVDGDGHVEIVAVESRFPGIPGITAPYDSQHAGVVVYGNDAWLPGKTRWSQYDVYAGIDDDLESDGASSGSSASWLVDNTFRSANVTLDPLIDAADLVAVVDGTCMEGCASGEDIVAFLHIENRGPVGTSGSIHVVVAVDGVVVDERSAPPLTPGSSAPFSIDIPSALVHDDGGTLTVSVSPEADGVFDCDVQNDVASVAVPSCSAWSGAGNE